MKNYVENKPPILKDTSFWEAINEYWHGLFIFGFIIIELIINDSNRFLVAVIYLSLLSISEILMAVMQNTKSKSGSLSRKIVQRIFPYLLFMGILVVCGQLLAIDNYMYFFVIAICVIFNTCLRLFFQNGIDNSQGIMNYLFGNIEKTQQESPDNHPISRFVFRVVLLAVSGGYTAWYIFTQIVQK